MFEIQTFKNTSDAVVVDKTITALGSIQGQLNEESGILNPSFTIESDVIPSFNYAKIPAFGDRYYFVQGQPVALTHNLWKITLKHDVLMNWKDSFRGLDAIIARQENSYNAYLTDSTVPVETDNQFFFQKIGDKKFSTKSNVLIYSASVNKED